MCGSRKYPYPGRCTENSKCAEGVRSPFFGTKSINQNWNLHGDWDGGGGKRGGNTKKLCARGMDIFLNSTIPEISFHSLNCPTPKDDMTLFNKVLYSAFDWLVDCIVG